MTGRVISFPGQLFSIEEGPNFNTQSSRETCNKLEHTNFVPQTDLISLINRHQENLMSPCLYKAQSPQAVGVLMRLQYSPPRDKAEPMPVLDQGKSPGHKLPPFMKWRKIQGGSKGKLNLHSQTQ